MNSDTEKNIKFYMYLQRECMVIKLVQSWILLNVLYYCLRFLISCFKNTRVFLIRVHLISRIYFFRFKKLFCFWFCIWKQVFFEIFWSIKNRSENSYRSKNGCLGTKLTQLSIINWRERVKHLIRFKMLSHYLRSRSHHSFL